MTVDWSGRFSMRARAQDATLGAILALAGARDMINFSGGFPDPSTFASGEIGAAAERLARDDAAVALQYTPSEGLAHVRVAMTTHVGGQGRTPSVEELVVTSGGIDALTMIGRTMVDPGDVVLVERPTYVGAVMGLQAVGASVATVPTDQDGIDVDALAELLGSGLRPKLLYVIPDHQNPGGRTLATQRRRQLVDLCARHQVLVVEDVAYRELSFSGRPLESLWFLDPDTVVQIGTFSKTFFPGVRLGWAVGPCEVVAAMAVAKQNTDQCSGALGQRLVQTALEEGWYYPHVESARALYARRAGLLMRALETDLSDCGEWTVPDGGFFSWVHLPGVDTRELASLASAERVAFVPGAGFLGDFADDEHLRLSFSRVDDNDISEGIKRIRHVLDAYHQGARAAD